MLMLCTVLRPTYFFHGTGVLVRTTHLNRPSQTFRSIRQRRPSSITLFHSLPQTGVIEHRASYGSGLSLLFTLRFGPVYLRLLPLRVYPSFAAAILRMKVIKPPLSLVYFLLKGLQMHSRRRYACSVYLTVSPATGNLFVS